MSSTERQFHMELDFYEGQPKKGHSAILVEFRERDLPTLTYALFTFQKAIQVSEKFVSFLSL